jgi:hypothetical protein
MFETSYGHGRVRSLSPLTLCSLQSFEFGMSRKYTEHRRSAAGGPGEDWQDVGDGLGIMLGQACRLPRKPLGLAVQRDGLAGATVAAGPAHPRAVPGVLLAGPPQLATHLQVSAGLSEATSHQSACEPSYCSAAATAPRIMISSGSDPTPPRIGRPPPTPPPHHLPEHTRRRPQPASACAAVPGSPGPIPEPRTPFCANAGRC